MCLDGLRPLWVGTYVRRVQGALLENEPSERGTRIDEINAGLYRSEWGSGLRGLESQNDAAEAQG